MIPHETPNGEESYEQQTASSRRSFAAARHRLPGGVSRSTLLYPPYPFFGASAEGAWLCDEDGNRYLDMVNNYTSLIHGHSHEPSVNAAIDELRRGGVLGAPSQLEKRFAELLSTRIPSLEKLRFALSGSEAVGFALRVARSFTGRPRVLKFEGGFHGCFDEVQQSIAARALEPGTFSSGVPNSEGLISVPTLVAVYNDLESVRAAFAAHGEEIAAVVSEPFLGNNGLVRAAPGFLAAVAEIAHAHGSLFVLDDVQGLRLAYGGSQELDGTRPDLTAIGKIIGGGMPLAGFGGRNDVMETMEGFHARVPQTGTFTAFSTALAAGLAAMTAFDRAAVERLNQLGAETRAGLRECFASHNVPVQINGDGSMFNIAVTTQPVNDYRQWCAVDGKGWEILHLELLTRGIYITARGMGCLSTPMAGAEVEFLLSAVDAALAGGLIEPAAIG